VTKVTQATATGVSQVPPVTECSDIPELARLRYFHGRALGALDLRREQGYHLDKGRLRNRLLHGWGIVCGLGVEIAPEEPCDPADEEPTVSRLVVAPGAAIDCFGDEIVVRNPRTVVLEHLLGEEDRRKLADEPATVYLTLCYRERPIEPMRPLLASGCEPTPACEYGRVCETYAICASLTRPDPGPPCEPCCGSCGDCCDRCLELAAIHSFQPGTPVTAEQLDVSGRRGLALHPFATITAVNWVHGATYSRDGANALLDKGIEVRFSRPVQVASLRTGVVDLTGIAGGGGRSADVWHIVGGFVDLPQTGLTDRFVFRNETDETLQYGDTVQIRIHGDLIVDECCRAIDANHIGGNVPVLDDPPAEPSTYGPDAPECPERPTGNGTEGGEFVSWIFVQDRSGKR
jgi:hypothetical protein